MSEESQKPPRKSRLSEEPSIHPSAIVRNSTFGRYTEIGERARIAESSMDDYSYITRDGRIWCAKIGKFANIADAVRINAPNHPTWRASMHHFTYRADDYFDDAEQEKDFFDWRRENPVIIGNDVWLGHGVTILPGVSIGDGAVIGAGAVVSKDVPAYTIMGGVPAKVIRERFPRKIAEAFQEMAWWDWSHEKLRASLDDFRTLTAEEFLEKHK